MPIPTPAPAEGPLTIEQAVGVLDAADKKEEQGTPAVEATDTEAAPAVTTDVEPEAVIDGEPAELEDGDAEVEETELPAIEPPRFWTAEEKARFSELPPDLQKLVLAKETDRDKVTSASLQKSAEARKAADGEASKLAQHIGNLDKLLPTAIETFRSRWEGVDWNAVVDQYGADAALKLRNDFDREQGVIQQLQAAKDTAEQVQFSKFVETEQAKIPELCPDLVDPKLGQERKVALGKFLIDNDIPPDAIRHITAKQTSIAYDAMRWRDAQAKAKAAASAPRTQPKPAVQPKPSVRPTAAPGLRGSPNQQRIAALSRKPSLTTDEAVELLDLKDSQP